MAVDYVAIRAENERRYGTDIGRIGPMLLADRYDNRAHFIYELLQNAEDAFSRNTSSSAPRSINFVLSSTALRVSHFGAPFTEANVRGICGIAESTKDLTAIGRFGIGFKSVYAFTDRPQIHSASEHFAIESFVWPIAIEACDKRPEETVFILPLAGDDSTAFADITQGLRTLGPRALLFLRHIEEIAWSVAGGASGLYLRGKPEAIGANARKIVVLGQGDTPKDSVEETWLVFSREVRTDDNDSAGSVEVAFALSKDDESGEVSVLPIADSALIVFFPTVVPTHLGFLVQGPYRTTPSRDNIPRHDPWNQHLVQETATLLVDALHSLREFGLLSTSALRSLPLDRANFGEGEMFSPLFAEVRKALSSQPLLPKFTGGHASAKNVKLARTQELRDLLSPSQLADLFAESSESFWLSEEVTQDRTPELRQYLIRELNIVEATPETTLAKLNKTFLEKQSDDWILRLYEFLLGQSALLRQGRLNDVPLVRLENGSHVTAGNGGKPQAFLPGPTVTDFPTVRRSVCGSKAARALLSTLGLTEPDPVDDVIWNLLPKYAAQDKNPIEYAADIQRILTAFGTDSKGQREKLVEALRETPFVRVVDTGDQSKWISTPDKIFIATQRLKDLFEGVPKVYLVDETYSCLRGEAIRDLLEACGATRYLHPVRVPSRFSWQELAEMRMGAGSTSGGEINDFTLRGLDQLLKCLATLNTAGATRKAALLWEALCDVVDRRGTSAFLGTYYWFYRTQRSCVFDAASVPLLNKACWVPDREGVLQSPEFVVFEETGWKANPFLCSKINFKPAIIEILAKEAGIEPGVIELLKKLGVTSEAELKTRLGIKDEAQQIQGTRDFETVDNSASELLSEESEPTPSISFSAGPESTGTGSSNKPLSGSSVAHSGSETSADRSAGGDKSTVTAGGGLPKPSTGGARTFVSYLAAHPVDEETDPDGLIHAARLALEDKAISLILMHEPALQRTRINNPGFDLVALDGAGTPIKWVEVKAMNCTMHDRPVGMSHSQFECARVHGDSYWLYVVERAGSGDQSHLIRIQDPAGRAKTFTFDRGWLNIAQAEENHADAP
jgi:Domain of unknown function (DUF3883)